MATYLNILLPGTFSATFGSASLEDGKAFIDGLTASNGDSITVYAPSTVSAFGSVVASPDNNVVERVNAKSERVCLSNQLPAIKKLQAGLTGEMYILGMVPNPTTDYFPGLGIIAEGTGNSYIAKINAEGLIECVRQFGTEKPGAFPTKALAVTRSGSYYVAGTYTAGSPQFGETVLPSAPSDQVKLFVAKFSSDGKVLWARAAQGVSRFGRIERIAADPSDGLVLLGGSWDGVYTFQEGGNDQRVFILTRLSSDGTPNWTRGLSGIRADFAMDASGNSFVVSSSSTNKVALQKFSPNGDLLWSRAADPRNMQSVGVGSIAVGSDGNCYVAGNFGADTSNQKVVPGQITFANTTITTTAIVDVFVASYSSTGDFRWVLQSVGLEPLWIGEAPLRYSDARLEGFFYASPEGSIRLSGSIKGSVQFGTTVLDGPGATEPPTAMFVASIKDLPSNSSQQPVLRIGATKSSVELSWPIDPPAFVLESAGKLESANWVAVNTPPSQEGSENVVTLPRTEHASFYRLRKP